MPDIRIAAIKANPRKGVRFFYVLFLLLHVPMAEAGNVEQIEQWQQNGAYELALSELTQKQPSAAASYATWEKMEGQRYALYQSLGRWKGILERHAALPANAAPAFRLWSGVQAVHALLALKDVQVAYERVRRTIWSDTNTADLQVWRAVMVQIYAAQQDDEAVIAAWRRYKQDQLQNQAQGDIAMSELAMQEHAAAQRAFARVLIRQERYQDAVRELVDDASIDGRLLFAEGQLLVSGGTTQSVYQLSQQQAESDRATPEQKHQAYVLMSRAAARQQLYRERVSALVKALAIPVVPDAQNKLMTINADELWSAYEAWGISLGLSAGLSADYESQWAAALKSPRPADEMVAMASVLVLSGRSPQSRERAAEVLLEALPQLDHGAEQTLWLLNESERLKQNYVGLPDDLQRAALRAALRVADLDAVKEVRQRRDPVTNPLADQANGVLDVHARLLLGEPGPANRFLNDGLANLSAWFRSSQQDLLVLLRDMESGGYFAPVASAGYKLATTSSDQDIRTAAAEHACRAMLKLGQHRPAAVMALDVLAQASDAEASDLALLAYEALWKSGLKSDAAQLWHRRLGAPEVREKAADLRRRLQVPHS